MSTEVFEALESNVRVYCRQFPAVFSRASGSYLWDEKGTQYIDFLAGAGALNYGHNEPEMRRLLQDYLAEEGIVQSLDLHTAAKRAFMEAFRDIVLTPRNLGYRMMFPGPAGTNAVEAALKLARRVTGRRDIAAFTNAFHGMTLGSLAATGSSRGRTAAGVDLPNVTRLPYDGYFGDGIDTMNLIERQYDDPSSGFEPPAAFIVESVQGEGGLNAASTVWLRRLAALARRLGTLLILDEIQSGCGRTGDFFGYEAADVEPDIVCLSKSLSGYGLPLALVLIRPELDAWQPGDHTGTFRGNNLAFVTGRAALGHWSRREFRDHIAILIAALDGWLNQIAAVRLGPQVMLRGRGLMRGLAFSDPDLAAQVSAGAFKRGVIAETCGPHDEVLKLLPPLNTELSTLEAGMQIIRDVVNECMAQDRRTRPRVA